MRPLAGGPDRAKSAEPPGFERMLAPFPPSAFQADKALYHMLYYDFGQDLYRGSAAGSATARVGRPPVTKTQGDLVRAQENSACCAAVQSPEPSACWISIRPSRYIPRSRVNSLAFD